MGVTAAAKAERVTTRIYCPDIECDSCVKLLTKRLRHEGGVAAFDFSPDAITITHDAKLDEEELVDIVREAGFRAATTPFERKSLGERWRHVKEHRKAYAIELRGLAYATGILLLLIALQAIAYVGFLNAIPGFLARYGWWLLYLDITVAAGGLMLWHVTAYKAKVTCMVGMMIGMTAAMQTGMMLGAVLGATNGFFVGAMAGMLVGTLVGIVAGRCCGVMGVMEGMMAGVMGGTMGPMISVMMFTDRLLLFMPFFTAINIAIVLGLSYMLYEEVVEGKEVTRTPLDFVTFASASIIATALFAAVMLYGPKSPLASFGL